MRWTPLLIGGLVLLPIFLFSLLLLLLQMADEDPSQISPVYIVGRRDLQYQIRSMRLQLPALSFAHIFDSSSEWWEIFFPSVGANILSNVDVYGGSCSLAKSDSLHLRQYPGDGNILQKFSESFTVTAKETLMEIVYDADPSYSGRDAALILGRVDRRRPADGGAAPPPMIVSPAAEVSPLDDVRILGSDPLRPADYFRVARDLVASGTGPAILYGGRPPYGLGSRVEAGRMATRVVNASRLKIAGLRLTAGLTCANVMHVRWWMLLVPPPALSLVLPLKAGEAFDRPPVEIVQDLSRCEVRFLRLGWGIDLEEVVEKMKRQQLKYRGDGKVKRFLSNALPKY